MSNITVGADKPTVAEPQRESHVKPKKKRRPSTPTKSKQTKRKATKAPVKQARAAKKSPPEPGLNKKAQVIAMMKRPKGATLAEITAATDWQKHTIRGFVSILGKKGELIIESAKNAAGERFYKISN